MQHRRIIKRGPIVLATHEDGSMDPSSPSSQGLFLDDTRFLSLFQVLLNGVQPVLMGSSEEILFEASFIFTNPELPGVAARDLGLQQHNRIEDSAVKIELSVLNWSLKQAELELSIEVGADFFDSFEARGVKRLRRGTLKEPKAEDKRVTLEYEGLDDVIRTTTIEVSPAMERFDDQAMYFHLQLEPAETKAVEVCVSMRQRAVKGAHLGQEPERVRAAKPSWFDESSSITTSNASVNAILARSIADLQVLLMEYEDGWVPAAGLPRFAVPFGRDSLITGLEALMWNPHISRDVLRFVAHRQGKEENPWNYEQPGKIMHEMHTGELARLKEVPFGLFYGSVDSTVLFLVLGGEYLRWTGDYELYQELEKNFDAAWKWIDEFGCIDGSGYVQYKAHTPPRLSSAALTVGLFNQGWKDSANSVVYSDGSICRDHPVALSEVQGDLYRALHLWGQIFSGMRAGPGYHKRGQELLQRAKKLKKQFNHEFWMPEKKYYAMALDGHHRPVDSITSNPAQCLWARLIDDENVDEFAERVMHDSLMTSWGLRTMATTEKAYNSFSYHNGSIWPWENALIAAGMKKYGLVKETQTIFDALLDASLYFEYRRWPEVYAGTDREVGGVLARQPDASRPQAWSAGAIFLLLQTVLGVATKPFERRVDITPALPSSINEIVAQNIRIGGGTLSLRLVREGNAALLEIMDNPDDLDVLVHPANSGHRRISGEDMPAVAG
jgi:glycogen debranching enzyme